MKYKDLGKTGIKISQLCFGTMSFGAEADEKTSAEMFAYCRDKGINIFDCADLYAKGHSEEILGKLIKDCREEVIITSKVYFPTGPDINAMGANRRHIRYAIEGSLKRLQTDRLDIYFIHRFDDITPLEETMRVLDDLVSEGKILYIGLSNFAAWQVEKAIGLAALNGWAPVACLQPMYNLVKRQAEVEILPMAEAEKLGVLPYSPLAGGLLSGKYGKNKRPASGRLVENKVYHVRYGDESVYEVAEKFTDFALANGYNPVSLAIAWVGSHPAVTAPIIGARNVEQLKDAIAAAEIEMTPELREEISRFSPEPPPATDRSEEKTETHFPIRR
ncbi:MAG: aldo/keto reductase [Candidatus Saccharicenans sp.]|nr:MAG: aldo/keto reductase [Candidatus Aminicenantes bacterium]HEK86660.1 aldo/keto reductase [Candidatus Aminicenantes bacterium]